MPNGFRARDWAVCPKFNGFFLFKSLTLCFTGAGATDVVRGHHIPLPGVRCKHLFGPPPSPASHRPQAVRSRR